MKIIRSIQGIVNLVQLKSESVERERNLDFMLNDNPLRTEGEVHKRRPNSKKVTMETRKKDRTNRIF